MFHLRCARRSRKPCREDHRHPCDACEHPLGGAVYLHLDAAFPHIREPSQSLFRMQPLDVIEEGPFKPRDNCLVVPEGPGLGVTLSKQGMAYCHRLFLEQGPYDKFHDPDRPGVFGRLPLR